MTTEAALLVRLDGDAAGIRRLLADIRSAKVRAGKALPGERTDVIRYEALSTELERIARRSVAKPGSEALQVDIWDDLHDGFVDDQNLDQAPPAAGDAARTWVGAGDIAVVLRRPFMAGPTPLLTATRTSLFPLAEPWAAPPGGDGEQLDGVAAIVERFRQQVKSAIAGEPRAALRPSGISNRILTEGLRAYVEGEPATRRDIPVLYKDGSHGPVFPMRCVPFSDRVPDGYPTYRFAMLSIRHTEMDIEVNGAWLRNTEISRPRPAGQTDRLAYQFSREQFDIICKNGPVLIYLYQTGLDAALIGVYRAVTEQLIAAPKSLVVVPRYFRRQPQESTHARQVAGYQQQTQFEESKRPWGC